MARVTVEDCIVKVPNRFELVVLAARRVHNITEGAQPTVERKNDKTPVIALREIAEGTLCLKTLWEEVVQSFRHHVELDDSEQEMADMLSEEQRFIYEANAGFSIEEVATDKDEVQIEESLPSGEDHEVVSQKN